MLTELIQVTLPSLVNAKLEYETLKLVHQPPSNVGEDKPNVQTSCSLRNSWSNNSLISLSKEAYPGQLYKPTEMKTDLASYTQTGLAGQQFMPDILGYKHVAATTD